MNAHAIKNLSVTTGDLIRAHRALRNLTQQQLADLAGLDKQTIWGLECGRNKPLLDTVGKVARALGVPLADLVPDEAPNLQAPPAPDASNPPSNATSPSRQDSQESQR